MVEIERIWGAECRISDLFYPDLTFQRTCWAPGAPILEEFSLPTTLIPHFCLSLLLTLHLTSIFPSSLLRGVCFPLPNHRDCSGITHCLSLQEILQEIFSLQSTFSGLCSFSSGQVWPQVREPHKNLICVSLNQFFPHKKRNYPEG